MNLDKQLGAGVLVDTEFFVHKGQLGVLMEKARGQQVGEIYMTGSDRLVDKLRVSPEFQRDLTNLQVLDAIAGQHDRHFNNMLVETDAKENYVKLKGIDNDGSFGTGEFYNDLSKLADRWYNPGYLEGIKNEQQRAALRSSYGAGLPPLVDAQLAEKIMADDFLRQAQANVEGLLSAEEIKSMTGRIEQVQAHIKTLQTKGRTVSDWSSGRTYGGEAIDGVFADDAHHSYVQRFKTTVNKTAVQRRRNNVLAENNLI